MLNQKTVTLANRVITHYCELAKTYELKPSAYIIYNSLIDFCFRKTENLDLVHTVSVSEIVRQTSINRETVRHALTHLNECGLAQKIDGRWVVKLSE